MDIRGGACVVDHDRLAGGVAKEAIRANVGVSESRRLLALLLYVFLRRRLSLYIRDSAVPRGLSVRDVHDPPDA